MCQAVLGEDTECISSPPKSSLGQMAGDWSPDMHETHHCGFNTSHLPLSSKLYSAQCWHIAPSMSTQLGCFSICYSSKPNHCRQHCVFSTAKKAGNLTAAVSATIKNDIFGGQAACYTVDQQCSAWGNKYKLLLISSHLPFGGTLTCTVCCSLIPGMIELDTCGALFQSAV